MALTARELERQRKRARKERERDARIADRARLRALRLNIRRAKQHGRTRKREVVQLCRTGRAQVRELAKAIRARKRAEALAEIAAARARSRNTCEARKLEARSRSQDSLQRASVALQAESEHQALLRRWATPPKLSGPQKRKATMERRQESDDEVVNNLPDELVPVFRVVRARIKAGPRRSRTEAFLEWAQSHPADVLAITDAELQKDVDRLIREEKRLRREVLSPGTYRRATEADLLARYDAYKGAPDVPF